MYRDNFIWNIARATDRKCNPNLWLINECLKDYSFRVALG